MKPESKFRKLVKTNLPDIFWTRIESWSMPGVPDCYGCKDGVMFWVELKITKDKKIKLSPFQKAWHFNHSLQGGRSFIMLQHLGERLAYIFPSSIAVSIAALSPNNAVMSWDPAAGAASWNQVRQYLLHSPLPASPQKPAISE